MVMHLVQVLEVLELILVLAALAVRLVILEVLIRERGSQITQLLLVVVEVLVALGERVLLMVLAV
jgi:hypothetical protein